MVAGWRAWLGLAVALVVLNFALSFHNLWPTPWITTRHELSVEFGLLVLCLALASELGRPPSRRVLGLLAVLVLVFAVGRYLEVTAPALYGRRINLYWDVQQLPNVAAMLIEAMPSWQAWLLAGALVMLIPLLYWAGLGLLTLLGNGLSYAVPRRFTMALAGILVLLYAAGRLHPAIGTLHWYSLPVSATYAQQLGFVYEVIADEDEPTSTATPFPRTSLADLSGSDVVILFCESYGATTLDRPDFDDALSKPRQALADAVAQTGRQAVSARVRSPTFGGASWLAHSTLLSGIEVSNNTQYQRLLTQDRDTLVHRFAEHGYRTVGVMPGLRKRWPEGAYYAYDTIYDADSLDYRGPDFGWWRIPDQFALARFDALEVAPSARPPLFAVINSISSHAPFHPVPDYQSDWQVLLGPNSYTGLEPTAEDAEQGGLSGMDGHYVTAVAYLMKTVAGYLRLRAYHDMVLIVVGDHQPPARISGPDASWDVPVHVIARDQALIAALEDEGFVTGLEPRSAAGPPMHELAAVLLRAFAGTSKRTRVAHIDW